jgi:hypothetical protein
METISVKIQVLQKICMGSYVWDIKVGDIRADIVRGDMPNSAYVGSENFGDHVVLAESVVEIPYTKLENITELQVAALRQQLTEMKSLHFMKEKAIEDSISDLLCLESPKSDSDIVEGDYE